MLERKNVLASGALAVGALILAFSQVAALKRFASRFGPGPTITLENVIYMDGPKDSVKAPTGLAWSPDGKLLAISSDLGTTITTWDYASQTKLHTVRRRYLGEWWLSFTPDGQFIVTSALEKNNAAGTKDRATLSLIDARTGQVAKHIQGPEPASGNNIPNDAKQFAVSAKDNRAVAVTYGGHPFSSKIMVYNASDWSLLRVQTLEDGSGNPFAGATNGKSVALDPASNNLALLNLGGELQIYNPRTGEFVKLFQAFRCSASAAAFSMDGRYFAALEGSTSCLYESRDSIEPDRLRLWDAENWQIVATITSDVDGDFFDDLSFSSDGRYLATLKWGRVVLWDARTLNFVAEVSDGGTSGVALSFDPNGSRLAIARSEGVFVVTVGKQ